MKYALFLLDILYLIWPKWVYFISTVLTIPPSSSALITFIFNILFYHGVIGRLYTLSQRRNFSCRSSGILGVQEPGGFFLTEALLSVLKLFPFTFPPSWKWLLHLQPFIYLFIFALRVFFSSTWIFACSSCLQGHLGLHAPSEWIRFTSQKSPRYYTDWWAGLRS